jgi:DNA polymerase V
LQAAGIVNALQLRDADLTWIGKIRGIQGARTVQELRGISCFSLEESPPPRKGVAHTRAFSRRITQLSELREAAAAYASRAAEKLRQHGRAAGVVTVYVMTNLFPRQGHRYFNARTFELPSPTADTGTIIKHAVRGIDDIYREGYAYKKAGVLLDSLVPAQPAQLGLFPTGQTPRSQQLMRIVDGLNQRFHAGTLQWAAAGLERSWQVKFRHRSQRYTTSWRELPKVTTSSSGTR